MKYLENRLRETKKYTNYQIQQILYLTKTLSADISKTIVLSIMFSKHFDQFFIAMILLFLLRSYSGGMHFHTYLGCLIATIIYFFMALYILPPIEVNFAVKVLCLTFCMLLCDRVGPVISKYRPPLSLPKILLCRNITVCLIFLFIIILYVIPEHPYITIGFWVIILHSCQLLAAKLLVYLNESKERRNKPC